MRAAFQAYSKKRMMSAKIPRTRVKMSEGRYELVYSVEAATQEDVAWIEARMKNSIGNSSRKRIYAT
jgi:hypothetical protein